MTPDTRTGRCHPEEVIDPRRTPIPRYRPFHLPAALSCAAEANKIAAVQDAVVTINVEGLRGVAILLVTVLVKLVFFPLANKSYESMSKMKKLQPEMKRLQERYKDDKMKQQQELMALYKKEKINPVGGCLPILLQMPIFFALFFAVALLNRRRRGASLYASGESLLCRECTQPFQANADGLCGCGGRLEPFAFFRWVEDEAQPCEA